MSPEKSSTSFLNVDIDLRAQDGLDDLIDYLGQAVLMLNKTNNSASLELTKESSSLEGTVRNVVDLIKGLPPEARTFGNGVSIGRSTSAFRRATTHMQHVSLFRTSSSLWLLVPGLTSY